jgi:hypothetical protein
MHLRYTFFGYASAAIIETDFTYPDPENSKAFL